MSISQNYPTIEPSLNLSFALTKKLDPRVTFSRPTTGVAYDGKTVAKAEENLLLRSQEYSATWTVTNLTPVTAKTAPDGTSTATEFTASSANATLTQSVTAIAGDYTFSVFLRRVTGTGNVDISSHSAGTWVTQTLTSTWTRFTVTQTLTAGARTPGIRVVDSGDVIEVWGAQLEQRSAPTAYTATTTQPITNYIPVLQTASANVARFDHNPVTGESLGLLVEEQRTNLVLRSEEFDNASWVSAVTVGADTIIAPDGTLSADKIIPSSSLIPQQIVQSITVTAAAHVMTVYAKAAGYSILQFSNSQNGSEFANFNLATGAVGSAGGSVTAIITHVGNGWYRCSCAYSAFTAGSVNFRVQVVSSATSTRGALMTGDGYSGIYIWGAQLEAGAFPTGYIKTVASQVTRSADSASMTGANFSEWYRQDEGTTYVDATARQNGSYAFQITDGTNNNYIVGGRYASSGSSALAATNGVIQANFGSGALVAKTAFAYKFNDFAVSTNAGTVATDTSGVIPLVNQIRIGAARDGGVNLNGTIKKLSYYPARLTNEQLQALTS
jgi:hypothetical protein